MNGNPEWAQARANLYKFLSAAYLEAPQRELVAKMVDRDVLDELESVFGSDVLQELKKFSASFDGNYEDLEQEFQDLFVVPLGRYVTPYESVYRDRRQVGDEIVHGLLMGPSTQRLVQFYREAGAGISEDFKELPDHIALELACMAFLCGQEARALERGDADAAETMHRLQQRLLDEHLLQWAPALCDKIRENSGGPFYRGIAGLTEASLRRDAGS